MPTAVRRTLANAFNGTDEGQLPPDSIAFDIPQLATPLTSPTATHPTEPTPTPTPTGEPIPPPLEFFPDEGAQPAAASPALPLGVKQEPLIPIPSTALGPQAAQTPVGRIADAELSPDSFLSTAREHYPANNAGLDAIVNDANTEGLPWRIVGQSGEIDFGNGLVIDVMRNARQGGDGWQWLDQAAEDGEDTEGPGVEDGEETKDPGVDDAATQPLPDLGGTAIPDVTPKPAPPIDTIDSPGVFEEAGGAVQQVGQDPISRLVDAATAQLLTHGLGPRGEEAFNALAAITRGEGPPIGGAAGVALGDAVSSMLERAGGPVGGAAGEQLLTSLAAILGGDSGVSALPGLDPGGEFAPIRETPTVAPSDAISAFADTTAPVGGEIGASLLAALQQILESQGQLTDENADLRFERAREITDRARNAALSESRSALAERGLASVAGTPQGQEAGSVRRIAEIIDPEFAAATRDIQISENERADLRFLEGLRQSLGLTGIEEGRAEGARTREQERFVQMRDLESALTTLGESRFQQGRALTQEGARQTRELEQGTFLRALDRSADLATLNENRLIAGLEANTELTRLSEQRLTSSLALATGLAEAEARALVDTLGTATDRQAVLSSVALDTLTQNRLWNQFLAEFGLERDVTLQVLQSDNIDDVLALLQMFGQFVDAARGGEVK